MFFYTNVVQNGNKILFRGYKDGKSILKKIDYQPCIFIESENGNFKSLLGDKKLDRNRFESISQMKDFIANMQDIDNMKLYGTRKCVTQFISETFKGDMKYDAESIKIVSIDIETTTDHGFIDTKNTPESILLITLKDFTSKEIITFGSFDFEFDKERIQDILEKQNSNIDISRLEKFKYIKCENEKELLTKFVEFWSNNYPDIITGYKINLFDIPYITNRVAIVLGKTYYKLLSPWGLISEGEININDNINVTYNWQGIASLDYKDLYEKYSYKSLENKKLDTVAKEELNRSKLTTEHKSFKDFYTKDPYTFVLYNIIDVDLIDELEEKMNLIGLVLSLSYFSKSNYEDVFSVIALWESILYNTFISEKVVSLLPNRNETDSNLLGGYVADIDAGVHEWCVAYDATSLYPSIIMALNMSPETLVESPILKKNDFSMIMKFFERDVDVSELVKKNLSIAANGQTFNNATRGWFPIMTENLFKGRSSDKKLMLKLEASGDTSKEVLKQITSLNLSQLAKKVLLNSLYGALANKYFSLYDPRIAEAITTTGQLLIINASKRFDDEVRKEYSTDGCYYSDTDSMHIELKEYVEKNFCGLEHRETCKRLSDYCESYISPLIKDICDDMSKYLNFYDPSKISFKREFIASKGIYTAKKRYCLYVYNSEGVEYDPPKIKIIGLEIVRSSTPNVAKIAMKDAVKIMLTSTNEKLYDYIEKFQSSWNSYSYDEIGCPGSANNLLKFQDDLSIYKSGTPMHIKGALMFNHLLKKSNVKMVEHICEGDKIKYLVLKEKNPFRVNCIAYKDSIPEEFGIIKYIDYDIMFNKAFSRPLSAIADAAKMELTRKSNLSDLFS